MTKLAWDAAGAKRYETGLDRGVLYPSTGNGVAWNGLQSVDEDQSDTVSNPYYIDGQKYLDKRTVGDFAATMKALTYPDEFLPYDGYVEYASGVFVADQPVNLTFGLSYRTRVGTDLNDSAGYKIHVLYNLTAKPSGKSFATQDTNITPVSLSWDITGFPVSTPGARPTCHFILDSTQLSSGSLTTIENALYGTSSTPPALPLPITILSLT